MSLGAHSILCIVILSLEVAAVAFLLFPLPRIAWKQIYRVGFDERRSICMIRHAFKALWMYAVFSSRFLLDAHAVVARSIFTLYALLLSFVSLIRIIHFAIREGRWYYYYYHELKKEYELFDHYSA